MIFKPSDILHFIKPEMIKIFKVREYKIAYTTKEDFIRLIDIDGKPFIARVEIKSLMEIPSSFQLARYFQESPRHYGTYYKDKKMYFPIYSEETIKSALLALADANVWLLRDSVDERAIYLYKKLVEEIYPAFYADQKPSLTNFVNETFGNVRAVNIDGDIWFVAKDVCDILGYSNSRDAIIKHVDDEDKMVINEKQWTQIASVSKGRNMAPFDSIAFSSPRGFSFINISGLFALILGSELPQAKQFKHWVTSEVLPTLYRTGSYAIFKQIN